MRFRLPALCGAAIGLTTATALQQAQADDLDARFNVSGQVVASADGDRVRERIRGKARFEVDGNDIDLTADLEGNTHDVELDLDLRQRGDSNRYRLRGDIDLTPNTRNGDRINEDFERTRGNLRVRENRNGDLVLRLKAAGREEDGNGRARVKLRGTSTSVVETTDDDSDSSIDVPDSVPQIVADTLTDLYPDGEVLDSGRDIDDGYWYFDVRSGGIEYDVEINDDGTVRQNIVDPD
ncbi:MAG: hypothetical protein AAF823_07435 [Planctomycetota bacterium]